MRGTEWHLPFGANLVGAEQTRFRIWAPGQQKLSLTIEGREPLAMTACAGGWFEVDARLRRRHALSVSVAGRHGRARSGIARPRRRCARPQHRRRSGRLSHGATRIGAADRGSEAVLYELHAGVLGGFAGVARELPRLADLGITAIELMPIAEFPGARNWGYDGALLFAPESSYGTPDQLKALIDAAHEHGLMIFLDVVYNHFGPDGNYLGAYAPKMFRSDVDDAVGPGDRFPARGGSALFHRERPVLADRVSLRRPAVRRRSRNNRTGVARRNGRRSARAHSRPQCPSRAGK